MFSTRRAVCFIALICLFVSEFQSSSGYEVAPTCKRLECPSYTVVATNPRYEIRSYDTAEWVSAPPISANSYKEAAGKSFRTLSAYFNGNNRDQDIVPMTAPVFVDVKDSTYTMYFYLPKKFQNNIPEPRSNDIKAVKLPRRKYAAVRRFGGFLRDTNIPEEIALLKKAIQGSPYQRAVDSEEYTVAGYNSPFELKDRVNEAFIWFD